ncbi:hypothetical protein QCA50_013456 [Cerrena zonata]|uniref:SUZ domain-containing protein n=1 Tax=Cerrena zonata TaxID=2478898 RepID=A0AAW0FPJ5_9APHY
MSVASHPQSLSDPWDSQPSSYQPTGKVNKTEAIPDDWDNEEEVEEEPQKVWEDANSKAPMPELLISSSTMATSAPPPAAFQPTLRILKRPTPSVSAASSGAPDSQQKSYAEREAQYQAARQRIFGAASPSTSVNFGDGDTSQEIIPPLSTNNTQGPCLPPATIIRNPKGPDVGHGDGPSKGFNRSKGKPPNTSS